MPLFKITQKQGNRTITSELEAKSLSDLKSFLASVSTAKITCIQEIVYLDDSDHVPVDDFNYFKQYKSFVSNSNKIGRQILLHNVKTNKNENELSQLIKQHLEVGGFKISSVACRLFMKD